MRKTTDSGQPQEVTGSPPWSNTTKAIVAVVIIVIASAIFIRFRQIVGPLIVAFILAYLLYPVTNFLTKKLKISWKLVSLLVILLLLLIVIGVLTLGGLAIFNQVQSLNTFFQEQIEQLPGYLENLTSQPLKIFGIFEIDLTRFNTENIVNQLLSLIQPLLTNAATIIGSVAGGAASTIGWILFTLIIAYFILADSNGVRSRLLNIRLPTYNEDFVRLRRELGNIWKAFLRNQIVLFILTYFLYVIILGILGVRYFYALALLAGFARFVPYVGPWVTWITYALVSFLQGSTIFGMTPLAYVILVVGVAILVDVIMDNFVVPRMMGDSLKVHPAAVVVAVIIFASLFGIIGVLLAAPVLATLQLLFTYAFYKLFDLDPWQNFKTYKAKPLPPVLKRISLQARRLNRLLHAKIQSRWPDGIPAILWIRAKFRQAVDKLARRTGTPTPKSTGGTDE